MHSLRKNMKSHKNHSWRRDCRYIQRARAAYGMKSEEEYKPYIKAKDKAFKSIWPNEDFGGYGSSGWKDNSGNRCRYQWEPKIKRNYEKIRRKKMLQYSVAGKSVSALLLKRKKNWKMSCRC